MQHLGDGRDAAEDLAPVDLERQVARELDDAGPGHDLDGGEGHVAKLRNQADQMAAEADKVLQQHAERIPPDLRSEIEAKKEALTSAARAGADAAELRRAMNEFNQSLQKVGQVVYQEAGPGASGSGGQSGTGQQEQQQGDVVDAEYREV